MYQKILVPLDGSAFAEQALCHAEQVAQAGQTEIHLLSVAPLLEDQSPAAVDLYPVYVHREYLLDHQQEMDRITVELTGYLERVSMQVRLAGYAAVWAIRFGQPAEEIIAYVAKTGCDLIAMSTHGRSGIGRWVYGSVADKVLRGSSIPVLLVRVKDANGQPA
jgi:nucleotide-binding universal stress UspA family protein